MNVACGTEVGEGSVSPCSSQPVSPTSLCACPPTQASTFRSEKGLDSFGSQRRGGLRHHPRGAKTALAAVRETGKINIDL